MKRAKTLKIQGFQGENRSAVAVGGCARREGGRRGLFPANDLASANKQAISN